MNDPLLLLVVLHRFREPLADELQVPLGRDVNERFELLRVHRKMGVPVLRIRENLVHLEDIPQGLAINLASRGFYVFAVYMTGLVFVSVWGIRH